MHNKQLHLLFLLLYFLMYKGLVRFSLCRCNLIWRCRITFLFPPMSASQGALWPTANIRFMYCSDLLPLYPKQLMSTKSRLQCSSPTGLCKLSSPGVFWVRLQNVTSQISEQSRPKNYSWIAFTFACPPTNGLLIVYVVHCWVHTSLTLPLSLALSPSACPLWRLARAEGLIDSGITAQKAACHPEPRSCCAAILYFMRRWSAISTDMVLGLVYCLWWQHADPIQAGL